MKENFKKNNHQEIRKMLDQEPENRNPILYDRLEDRGITHWPKGKYQWGWEIFGFLFLKETIKYFSILDFSKKESSRKLKNQRFLLAKYPIVGCSARYTVVRQWDRSLKISLKRNWSFKKGNKYPKSFQKSVHTYEFFFDTKNHWEIRIH